MSLALPGSSQVLFAKCRRQQARVCIRNSPVVIFTRRGQPARALPEKAAGSTIDIKKLSDIITAQALDGGEQQYKLEELAKALGEPLAVVRNMAFRQKALLGLEAAELKAKIEEVAKIVDVSYEKARQMAVIQPLLLTETQKQAEALSYGLRIICHDLKAPREEIVDIIINNPTLLHGRSMRLSAADMAHLALLRVPKGRIVD
ncbi:hypothetical protein CHLRE_06g278211v5 [Chlamydomonas reinhardtii]|uniref:Uncharacterized protein n=1 Tax=Chlamydomonas reinhardtii TaxID=3055 RepID=A8J8Z0_CHLRE|nr:uncharacterized protein CHLRE_06g278211v5 [Chlamydomonas reinhardtii]PNW82322.1 hypothetical protein CHLRE_06g278211v5 [Chlamydomonas reinhardtii]|eukprot:XP_001698072.1 predicted protein [Chlamydomonas reinhardtii]